MTRQSLMLIGGVANGDYSWLLENAGKAAKTWACPKRAQIGDLVFIYISAPESKVVATAKIIGAPRPGKELGYKWRYMGRIGPIRLLPSPISLAELQRLCPRWKWLNYPRAYAYIPTKEAGILNRRANQKAAPPEPLALRNGAGFGTPETNAIVERAAVKAVKRYYKQRGYTVRSREREKIAYDLDVAKNGRVLHVEVKGVSNAEPSFPITVNEVNRAEEDATFVLAVVTNARNSRQRKLGLYTGKEFTRRFARQPISFMAKIKEGTRMPRRIRRK